jgi:pimeloyl-ACP methyl ester carboxylesterase
VFYLETGDVEMSLQQILSVAWFFPTVLLSQQPERASFAVVSGKDTVTAERFTRTPTELMGDLIDRVRGGRIRYRATLGPEGLITRLETTTMRSPGDTIGQHATFTFSGDSMIAQIGNAAPAHIPVTPSVLAIVNPSVAFMEQMLIRARAIGRDTVAIPIFVLGAPQAIPLTVTRMGRDSVRLDYAGISARLAASADGRVLGGSIPAQRIQLVRGGPLDTLQMAKRDYTAPADAPYTAEDVVVVTPAGLRLTGTLTIPRGRATGRAPAIVTITGSGPEDRDEESALIPGYRPFRELADTLGRRGIAVLRLDDRGVNGSDVGPPTVTSADLADDIRAAVAYLRTRPEIDAARIGLVGHSEGGIIAPMVAAADPQIRAIVLMAATASPGRAIVAEQNRFVIDSIRHLQGAARDSAIARATRGLDSTAAHQPWLKFFLDYDPRVVARQVKTPVLILQGETDRQVPPSEAEKLGAAFRSATTSMVTVHMFPETNHLFLADKNGAFADASGRLRYSSLPSLSVRREVLGTIADWLAIHLR